MVRVCRVEALLLRMLNPNNKRGWHAGLGRAELAKSPPRPKKRAFKRKRRSIAQSSYAYKLRRLFSLYLRLGLGLGEAFLQAEADLNEFAW
jgi:hypothetical protein